MGLLDTLLCACLAVSAQKQKPAGSPPGEPLRGLAMPITYRDKGTTGTQLAIYSHELCIGSVRKEFTQHHRRSALALALDVRIEYGSPEGISTARCREHDRGSQGHYRSGLEGLAHGRRAE